MNYDDVRAVVEGLNDEAVVYWLKRHFMLEEDGLLTMSAQGRKDVLCLYLLNQKLPPDVKTKTADDWYVW